MRGAEGRFRLTADRFIGAAYRGNPSAGVAAMLSSQATLEYLDRMSVLEVLATEKSRALAQLQEAVSKASGARQSATPARSGKQQYGDGTPVVQSDLRPGGLVFYDDGSGDPGAIHHVGMYVGDGKMVDAPTEGQVVNVRSIEGDGHYIGARRIVG